MRASGSYLVVKGCDPTSVVPWKRRRVTVTVKPGTPSWCTHDPAVVPAGRGSYWVGKGLTSVRGPLLEVTAVKRFVPHMVTRTERFVYAVVMKMPWPESFLNRRSLAPHATVASRPSG